MGLEQVPKSGIRLRIPPKAGTKPNPVPLFRDSDFGEVCVKLPPNKGENLIFAKLAKAT